MMTTIRAAGERAEETYAHVRSARHSTIVQQQHKHLSRLSICFQKTAHAHQLAHALTLPVPPLCPSLHPTTLPQPPAHLCQQHLQPAPHLNLCYTCGGPAGRHSPAYWHMAFGQSTCCASTPYQGMQLGHHSCARNGELQLFWLSCRAWHEAKQACGDAIR